MVFRPAFAELALTCTLVSELSKLSMPERTSPSSSCGSIVRMRGMVYRPSGLAPCAHLRQPSHARCSHCAHATDRPSTSQSGMPDFSAPMPAIFAYAAGVMAGNGVARPMPEISDEDLQVLMNLEPYIPATDRSDEAAQDAEAAASDVEAAAEASATASNAEALQASDTESNVQAPSTESGVQASDAALSASDSVGDKADAALSASASDVAVPAADTVLSDTGSKAGNDMQQPEPALAATVSVSVSQSLSKLSHEADGTSEPESAADAPSATSSQAVPDAEATGPSEASESQPGSGVTSEASAEVSAEPQAAPVSEPAAEADTMAQATASDSEPDASAAEMAAPAESEAVSTSDVESHVSSVATEVAAQTEVESEAVSVGDGQRETAAIDASDAETASEAAAESDIEVAESQASISEAALDVEAASASASESEEDSSAAPPRKLDADTSNMADAVSSSDAEAAPTAASGSESGFSLTKGASSAKAVAAESRVSNADATSATSVPGSGSVGSKASSGDMSKAQDAPPPVKIAVMPSKRAPDANAKTSSSIGADASVASAAAASGAATAPAAASAPSKVSSSASSQAPKTPPSQQRKQIAKPADRKALVNASKPGGQSPFDRARQAGLVTDFMQQVQSQQPEAAVASVQRTQAPAAGKGGAAAAKQRHAALAPQWRMGAPANVDLSHEPPELQAAHLRKRPVPATVSELMASGGTTLVILRYMVFANKDPDVPQPHVHVETADGVRGFMLLGSQTQGQQLLRALHRSQKGLKVGHLTQ